jgi:hypothetical protein
MQGEVDMSTGEVGMRKVYHHVTLKEVVANWTALGGRATCQLVSARVRLTTF